MLVNVQSKKDKIEMVKIDYNKYNHSFQKGEQEKISYNQIGELISKARMVKRPLVIVEGIDDVKVYENICKRINKKLEIKPIETIKGYSEGCVYVRKFIEDSQPKINESPENIKYIRGIIDRDASAYRGEDYSHLKCLFILKAYSYESHFVSKKHVQFLLENLLKSHTIINDQILEYLTSEIEKKFMEIYYISLEALKNACVRGYDNVVGYSFNYGQIEQHYNSYLQKVMAKKVDLDEFAKQKKIDKKKDLFKVVKGKWLIGVFLNSVYKKIESLSQNCKNSNKNEIIPKCHYCDSEKKDKCLWKVKNGFGKKTASSLVYEFIDDKETKYIQDEFLMLG